MSRLSEISFEPLEPYDGKLSCTVLRGERGSNAPDLPDMNTIHPNAIKLNLNKFVGIFMFLVHVRDYKDTHIYKKGTYKLKKEYDLIG